VIRSARIGLLLVVLLGVGSAVGCAGSDAAKPWGPGEKGVRSLIYFQWAGGFMGRDDRLWIDSLGNTRLESRGFGSRRFVLTVNRLRKLRTAAKDAKFATLQASYSPPTPIPDGSRYVITYDGRTVRIEDGAQFPKRLARVRDILLSIVNKHTTGHKP
jgi:hypothetical protein